MSQTVVTRGKSKQNQSSAQETSRYPAFPKLNLKNSCKTNTSYEIVISPSIKSSKATQNQNQNQNQIENSETEQELETLKDKLMHAESANNDLQMKICQLNERIKSYKHQLIENEHTIEELRSALNVKKQEPWKKRDSSSQTQELVTISKSMQTEKIPATEMTSISSSKDNIYKPKNVNRKVNRKHKLGRVLLLADSHGRDVADVLESNLTEYQVSSLFKPNATFDNVTKEAQAFTCDFGSSDYVLIMAGINDILQFQQITKEKISHLLSVLQHTNTFVLSIPYWQGRDVLNNLIFEANNNIYRAVNDVEASQSAKFIDVNSLINYSHMTRAGLHVKLSGKRVVFKYISEIIMHDRSISNNKHHSNLIYINPCNGEGDIPSQTNFLEVE